MRIDHLRLVNFRGFEDFELDLHPRCTVLAGVNGSGKTSVLDGLSVAMGAWFLGFHSVPTRTIQPDEARRAEVKLGLGATEPQYPVRVAVSGTVAGNEMRWVRALNGANGRTTTAEAKGIYAQSIAAQADIMAGNSTPLPVLINYGAGRLWVQKRASTKKRTNLESVTAGYQDCLDTESNQKLFTAWMAKRQEHWALRVLQHMEDTGITFEQAKTGADPWLKAVESAAVGCIEDAQRLRFDTQSDTLQVVFNDGRSVPFELLSDGYRNLVALSADIAWRAVRLNSHWKAEAPQRTTGVVLIDELELHLHPGWQRTVLPRLLKLFPNMQFIITTHSPHVLSSVPAEYVRFLAADGTVQRVGVAGGLDTNTLLRELMGVPERPDDVEAGLAQLGALIEQGDLHAAKALYAKLYERLGDLDPALSTLEWELHDLEVHGAAD
jgi:predicted ATP-binding protein involved in virulence